MNYRRGFCSSRNLRFDFNLVDIWEVFLRDTIFKEIQVDLWLRTTG